MWLSRRDERVLEQFLSSESPPDADCPDELAEALSAIRLAYSARPDEGTERAHLAAIATTARDLVEGTPGPTETPAAAREPALGGARGRRAARGALLRRSRLALAGMTLVASALALAGATAGLAVAGVDLPDPASDAFERVGVTLPNQTAEAVREVKQERSPGEGCAFGLAVAKAAGGEGGRERKGPRGRCLDRTGGSDAGARSPEARGAGEAAPGPPFSVPPAARSTRGDEASAFGRAQGREARGSAPGGRGGPDGRGGGRDQSGRRPDAAGPPHGAAPGGPPQGGAGEPGTEAPPSGGGGPPGAAGPPQGSSSGAPPGTPGESLSQPGAAGLEVERGGSP